MAQAFVTTYRNHYRWNKPAEKTEKPIDPNFLCATPEDWIDSSCSEKQMEMLNIPYAEALIKQSTRRLLFSTYQVNYCQDKVREKRQELRKAVNEAKGEPAAEVVEQSFENELLKYCEDLYNPKKGRLLPPTDSTRRIHGCIRSEYMYTPLTNYQLVYGKAGYDIMRNPLNYLNVHEEREKYNNPPQCSAAVLKEIEISEKIKEEREKREKILDNVMEGLDNWKNTSKTDSAKSQRIRQEKEERDQVLDKIMGNLSRCTNYVPDPVKQSCSCFTSCLH